jgi:hypothetical protein
MLVLKTLPLKKPIKYYERIYDEENLDVENKGFLEANSNGRTTNYTAVEDKLICATWNNPRMPIGGG